MIPADLVTRSAKYLRENSGARLEMHDYPIAHEISDAETNDINAWLLREYTLGAAAQVVG